MKKSALLTTGLLASLLTAQAQFFTPGDIAVVRIGGTNSAGAGEYVTTSDDGNTVYIDEYTTNGTLVKSLPIPASGSNALIESGEPYEGLMTVMPDQSHLVIIGYNTPYPYSLELIDSTNTFVPRIVATIDAYGNIAYPITNTSIFDSSYVATCAASDGTNYWAIGTGPSSGFNQVAYLGTATNGTTSYIVNNLFNSGGRSINIFDVSNTYQMYVTGYTSNESAGVQAGGFLCSNISGALPTSLTGTTNLFPSGLASGNTQPYDLAINPAGTIAYQIDEGTNGIIKYTNSGSGWISNYTILLTNTGFQSAVGSQRGLSVTADWTQTPPVLYAVTAETYTNRLVRLTDAGTAASANATVVNLAANVLNPTGANSGTNTFRGVRFVPVPLPEITIEPTPLSELPGATATFSATVTGIPTPTFQWYSNSPANPTYVAIPAATNSTLALANVNQSQNGSIFYLVAVNTYGTAESTPVLLTVQNPAILTEPVGATNLVGSAGVTLSVSAIGSGALTYQWLANGVPIANATSSTFTVPSSTVSNAASYTVIVTNTGASITSITSAPTVVSYSEYLLYDTFSYPNGNLIGDPGSPWTDIADTPVFLETNGRVQLTQTNTGDAQSLFIVSNVQNTVIWSSFIINLSTLPASPDGVYFANLEDLNYGFYPAIYILTSNAFPGTYRLGISTTNVNYSDGKGGPDATGIIPVDLAPGIDYQVVYAFDMTANDVAYLAINPNVTSDVDTGSFENDPNTAYTTTHALPTNGLSAAGLRQSAGEGVLQIDNLEVSLDTTVGSATICGYCAVTAGITPQAPVVGLNPAGFTNYIGGSNVMEVAASAIGSGIIPNYYWYKNTVASPGTYTQITDGGDVTGSSTAALTLSDETAADAGTYYVVVSNSVSGTQSASTVGNVITTPTAPFFISPTNATTNTIGIDSSVTFTASAEGSGPITYEWYFNNGTNNTDTGVAGSTLNLTSVALNQSGTYTVVATGTTSPAAVSSNFVLIVSPPVVTTIGYLNSLMNLSAPSSGPTLAASNTTTEYTVTGTVIVATNLSAAANSEYYVQDSTGGIDFYVGGDPSFRPVMGDVVTVTGVLSLYFNTLQLTASTANASETYIIETVNPTPPNVSPVPPKVIPVGYTQSQPLISITNYEGTFVTLTNVYFEGAGGVFQNETDVTVTNKAGVSYGVTVYPGEEGAGAPFTSIIGEPIPAFAYSVSGALNEYSTTDWELDVTRYSDIVTAPPPPVTNLTATVSGVGGANITLMWTSVPYQYTYSVWSATNVTGPYAPLQSGLWFGGSNAVFTNIGPKSATMFYEIVSP